MIAWLVAIMIIVAPPGRTPARESRADGEARYALIAAAIEHAVGDVPPLPGAHGRERLALILTSVAFYESGFSLDVDTGARRGDHGRSWGLFQANLGRGRTAEGWTGPDLAADRKLAALAAVHAIRRSMIACRSFGVDAQLGAYTAGDCKRGAESSAIRMGAARRWFAAHPPPEEVTMLPALQARLTP